MFAYNFAEQTNPISSEKLVFEASNSKRKYICLCVYHYIMMNFSKVNAMRCCGYNVKFMRVSELVCESPMERGTVGEDGTETETEEKQDWTDVEGIHRWRDLVCEYITTNCHYPRSQGSITQPHIYINDQSLILMDIMVLLFYTCVAKLHSSIDINFLCQHSYYLSLSIICNWFHLSVATN